jgi:hypothetical protein
MLLRAYLHSLAPGRVVWDTVMEDQVVQCIAERRPVCWIH